MQRNYVDDDADDNDNDENDDDDEDDRDNYHCIQNVQWSPLERQNTVTKEYVSWTMYLPLYVFLSDFVCACVCLSICVSEHMLVRVCSRVITLTLLHSNLFVVLNLNSNTHLF